MNRLKTRTIAATALIAILLAGCTQPEPDPMASWKDTDSKRAIMHFVESTTTAGSPDFVPVADRIAVFDNDGTLWSEQPLYFQALFIFDRIGELAAAHPEWETTEPFASVLDGDMESALAGGEHALITMAMATHAGMTTQEFEASVKNWMETARHPTTGKPYSEMVFQPMLELLEYLRRNDYQTFIVSGGGVDFMRAWADEVYGIPRHQIVGTSIKTVYEVGDNGPALVKVAELNFIDDKEGKPVGIHQQIGRRPVIAFGNSDGDFQMLEWTTSGPGPRFAAIVHHDDPDREWAYDRDSHIGRLVRGLDEGPERGWTIISIRNDWNEVFP